MLGVHRLTTRGAEYYLADLARELPLPPLGEDGGLAAWSGRAAQGLGLRRCHRPRASAGGPRTAVTPRPAIGCDRNAPPFSASI